MAPIKIIAEIGINHDGLYDKAKALVLAASRVGAQAVKFQYRNLENSYSSGSAKEIGDEILFTEIGRTFLKPGELLKLANNAHAIGLEVGISFFDQKDIEDFKR